jgi:hypothetical protein
MKPRFHFFFGLFFILILFSECQVHFVHRPRHEVQWRKPVIYLYPQKSELISVKLKMDFPLTFTSPIYHGEWKVIANTDGSIFNPRDGNSYPYLFWEGRDDHEYSFEKGFCVKGDSTRTFLKRVLPQMGLIPKEYNEFIEYWAPLMENHPYNIITFPTKEYTDRVKLDIFPAPDSELRVLMIFKSSSKKTSIAPESFSPFARKGFSVVEWGGMNADENVSQ